MAPVNENLIKRAAGAAFHLRKKLNSKLTPDKVKKVAKFGSGLGKKITHGAIKLGGSDIAAYAGPMRAGLQMARDRVEKKRKLAASQEFVDYALNLAESKGWSFDTDQDVAQFLDVFTEAYLDEMAVGMATIGTIKMEPQRPGGDRYPGLEKIATDGQRAGPRTSTMSGDDVSAKLDKKADIDQKNKDPKQTRGPDSFPALSYARKDGSRAGPKAATRSAEEHHPVKAESLHVQIFNSLAGKRVRDLVNQGVSPSPVEIKGIAEGEGFRFGSLNEVEQFMTLALVEKLYPSTGPTHHANQMKGDEFPALSDKAMDIRGLKKAPRDGTTGQNKTGARAAKDSGEAPHRPSYKKDGPKGATRQFEKEMKVCPVCVQKNSTTRAHCGGCGATLPPHPESHDGGVPANMPSTKKGRNWNVATDGGTPNVKSPYGGSKNSHYYLKKPPAPMKEDIRESKMPESSRMVLHDLLEDYKAGRPQRSYRQLVEMDVDYSPTGVHDKAVRMPSLAAVNAKAKLLGLNPITEDELNRVVGMFQQGETVGKVKLYTGVELRLVQSIANMLGIGASHGMTLGMTDHVASANLHPGS